VASAAHAHGPVRVGNGLGLAVALLPMPVSISVPAASCVTAASAALVPNTSSTATLFVARRPNSIEHHDEVLSPTCRPRRSRRQASLPLTPRPLTRLYSYL